MTTWQLFHEYMLILNAIWPLVAALIPETRDPNRTYKRGPGAGAKRTPDRILVNTILYSLMTASQWNAIVPDKEGYFCRGKTAHKWFMRWGRTKFFENLFNLLRTLYDVHSGLSLKWISIDGALYKAPLGQELVGRNPTDRGKRGTKRSLCVDDKGIILVMVHAGANVHDCKLLEPTLQLLKEIIPSGIEVHICLDAGYVGYAKLVESYGFIPHIRPRGEEKKLIEKDPSFKARRWIVETRHSHINQFRRMKIRYEKLAVSHKALSHLAAAMMTIRTIFRMELGEDSLWYNKDAQRHGRQKRTRDIDLSKYATLGETLLQQAAERKLISEVQGQAA